MEGGVRNRQGTGRMYEGMYEGMEGGVRNRQGTGGMNEGVEK